MRNFAAVVAAILVPAVSHCAAVATAPPVIEVQVTGRGEPLIFIPGVASPGAVWEETVAHLQDRYECHVVSIAGFGSMAPVKTGRFLDEVRSQIIAHVRSQKLHKPTLIGHSLGGALALAVGEKAPDLPSRIIVVDSLPFLAALRFPGVRNAEEAKQAVAKSRREIEKQSAAQFAPPPPGVVTSDTIPESSYFRRINQLCASSDPATVATARIELFSTDFRPHLGKIRCPILVLGALAGKMPGAPQAVVEKFYRAQYAKAPQTRFEFFPKSRHYLMLDDFAGFCATLDRELAAP